MKNLSSECLFPEIYQAVAGPDYVVYAYGNDGRMRLVDMKPFLEKGGVFASLQDEQVFRETLTVMNGSVAWDIDRTRNESTCIDIDPFAVFACPVVEDIPWER